MPVVGFHYSINVHKFPFLVLFLLLPILLQKRCDYFYHITEIVATILKLQYASQIIMYCQNIAVWKLRFINKTTNLFPFFVHVLMYCHYNKMKYKTCTNKIQTSEQRPKFNQQLHGQVHILTQTKQTANIMIYVYTKGAGV